MAEDRYDLEVVPINRQVCNLVLANSIQPLRLFSIKPSMEMANQCKPQINPTTKIKD
jgi:hypothetical protein